MLLKLYIDLFMASSMASYLELNTGEFSLGETLTAVMNQAMIPSREREVQVILDSPADPSSMHLSGDGLRLQQVLADFLMNALLFTPARQGSSITLRVTARKEPIGTKMHIVHLEFR